MNTLWHIDEVHMLDPEELKHLFPGMNYKEVLLYLYDKGTLITTFTKRQLNQFCAQKNIGNVRTFEGCIDLLKIEFFDDSIGDGDLKEFLQRANLDDILDNYWDYKDEIARRAYFGVIPIGDFITRHSFRENIVLLEMQYRLGFHGSALELIDRYEIEGIDAFLAYANIPELDILDRNNYFSFHRAGYYLFKLSIVYKYHGSQRLEFLIEYMFRKITQTGFIEALLSYDDRLFRGVVMPPHDNIIQVVLIIAGYLDDKSFISQLQYYRLKSMFTYCDV